MAYGINPFTGSFDNVNYSSSFSSDGDLQVGNAIAGAISFLGGKGLKFYQGISSVLPIEISIKAGQPIPIGMGLTFTYAGDIPGVIVSLPGGIKRGQPIPIGLGLTNTYADDIN